MKFSFLTDPKAFECNGFKINPVSEFDGILTQFYQSMNVSNGWFYGPEEKLKKTSLENKKFEKRGPINCCSFFQINPTHKIISETYSDDHLRFLILCYGFLQGLYLTPEGYSYLGRTAYEPGKLNGLFLMGSDYVNGMECVNRFYISSNDEQRNQMFSSIHWFLLGQGYYFDWDKFDAQYKVLDGLYKLSGIRAPNHASRPIELAIKYNITLPHWAELDSTGKKSKLSKLRNELVHEAKFGGHPIGYSFPDEDYSLEFTSFNTKLISAMLDIDTPYLAAESNDNQFWSWDIKT